MKYWMLFALMISNSSWAAYSIDSEVELKDSRPVRSSVVVNEGESGAISFNETTIRFLLTKQADASIKIQAEILKNSPDGMQTLAKPTVITRLGSPAEISSHEKDGSLNFRLKLTPREKL